MHAGKRKATKKEMDCRQHMPVQLSDDASLCMSVFQTARVSKTSSYNWA
jgi:hypothetical protein